MNKFAKALFVMTLVIFNSNIFGIQSSPEIDGYLADSAAKGRLSSCQTHLKLYDFSREAISNALCQSIPDIDSYYFQISDNKIQLLLDYVKIATLLINAGATNSKHNNTTALTQLKKLLKTAKELIVKKCIDTEINCEEVTDKDKKELHFYSIIISQYKKIILKLKYQQYGADYRLFNALFQHYNFNICKELLTKYEFSQKNITCYLNLCNEWLNLRRYNYKEVIPLLKQNLRVTKK